MSRKVVINTCHGGFGLSEDAQIELYKRGCGIIKAYIPEEYYGGKKGWEEEFEEDKKFDSTLRLLVVDGKILSLNDAYDSKFRSDPILVSVVEELGKRADGECASLEIVEIPDDVKFEIAEYDGWEHVAEVHRIWP